MLHSYPTRYHGPIYTRPMYALPFAERPNDFALEPGLMGLGEGDMGAPPAWKWPVAIGLTAVTLWVVIRWVDNAPLVPFKGRA
jgi:hypothetical protein